MKLLATILLLVGCASAACTGSSPTWTVTLNGGSISATDVQTCVTNASDGDTINIVSGSGTWSSGVTISGKTVKIVGAGSGRIIATSTSTLTVGTGSKTLTIATVGLGSGANPLVINNGDTLTIGELGVGGNSMTGTVTSYNSGTGSLVMNITSSSGSCGSTGFSNCKRWNVSTPSSTTLYDAETSSPMFEVYESTTGHVDISGIRFSSLSPGNSGTHMFNVDYTASGQQVILHDMWITFNNAAAMDGSGNNTPIYWNINRGLMYRISFDDTDGSTTSAGAISIQKDPRYNAWTETSYFGSLDTTDDHKVYIEDCDFHAFAFAGSTDFGATMAQRYNLWDNTQGVGTHGPDSGPYGQRYFEAYDNTALFEGYNDGTTKPLNWWFLVRGGTYVITANKLPSITSTDYGTKSDISLHDNNLYDNSGTVHPCWGVGTSGGADYYTPRQVGYGYVTGLGTTSGSQSSCTGLGCTGNNFSGSYDYATYVGDSEPAYSWSNMDGGGTGRSLTESVANSGDFNNCAAGDSASNYIQLNRDYFEGNTKSGYSPYTYPNPLRGGSNPNLPAPSKGMMVSDLLTLPAAPVEKISNTVLTGANKP